MAKKLLLVEYEPRYIDKVRTCAGADFDVLLARDGDEALNLYGSDRPDIVLLSAVLPKSRANDVIREIRRKGGATAPPILLMMSGYKGSNPKADAQRIGAFDILEKPFSEDTFRSLVFEALDSTDSGNQTMRIPVAQLPGKLTASDIFSDVLDDLSPEPKAPPTPTRRPTGQLTDLENVFTPPAPTAAAPPKPSAPAGAMDKRLEETLSGIMPGKRPSAPPAAPAPAPPPAVAPPPRPPSAAPPPPPPPVAAAPRPFEPPKPAPPPKTNVPRPSTDFEVESMLTQTLSGMDLGASKPKPAPAPPPPAAPPAPKAPPAPAPAPAATPARAASASDQDRFGQYQLIEKIATGGMAEVFKARMSGVDGFQKIVAIKKILPHMAASEDFISMFADEAKLAAQLNHPNIIHIYDLGKAEKSYYIAMEYVEGRDLRSILKSGHELGLPLPPELALFIASKLAAALDYAHRRKDFDGKDLSLVHRDVSPQNVLISFEGDIKLCDFGIAKAASKSSQTQAGALKGKLQYMSPEQAAGKSIDRRSDLFSLGSVLYEMLVGEKLFKGDTDLTILEQVRSAKIEPPSSRLPDIPRRVDSIVQKALARNLEERYQNASDLQRDLESVLYTFSPAPGSADLAIYLHHLLAEERSAASSSDAAFDSAFAPSSDPKQAPAKSKKAKGTVVQRRTTGVQKAALPSPAPPAADAAPAPATGKPGDTKTGVFGAYSSKRIAAEKKGRTPLYVAIGAAAVLLIAGVTWLTRKPAGGAAPAPATATTTAAPAATTATAATASSSTFTEKSVEEEVKKQLAAKQKELEKSSAQKTKEPLASAASATAAAPPPPRAVALPRPVPVQVAQAPEMAPAPIVSAPRKIEAAPVAPPPPTEAGVKAGDLVGPGPGVVEPEMTTRLNVQYPVTVRQQRVSGQVTVLALVDENGRVQSARVQSGIVGKAGVNDAVLSAVKAARFRPATKDGVPVKMYKAISVDVQP